MKNYLGVLLMFGLTSCAAMTADPWGWLDHPEQQYWSEVVVRGFGREMNFSYPDRPKSGGQHVRVWPNVENGERELLIELSTESLHEPAFRIAQFVWDEYWGGFYKEGDYDFLLDVWLIDRGPDSNLLDLSTPERVQREYDSEQDRLVSNDWRAVEKGKRFLSEYWVKPFKNSQGLVWISKNQPQVTADHEVYLLPVSDSHELKFTFFVNEKRGDFKDDPEWRQGRWDLVKKIMNTVSIEPNPFPDE